MKNYYARKKIDSIEKVFWFKQYETYILLDLVNAINTLLRLTIEISYCMLEEIIFALIFCVQLAFLNSLFKLLLKICDGRNLRKSKTLVSTNYNI